MERPLKGLFAAQLDEIAEHLEQEARDARKQLDRYEPGSMPRRTWANRVRMMQEVSYHFRALASWARMEEGPAVVPFDIDAAMADPGPDFGEY